MSTPEFVYFDLGMVLVNFSVERMLDQMAAASGLAPERVREVVFERHLQLAYETGQITTDAFYQRFCEETGTCCPQTELVCAASDIFELNRPMVPLVGSLRAAGYRLGILSNTCESHWQLCYDRWRMLRECFQVYALSYEIGAVKPHRAIFERAAALAGVAPQGIYYVDDIAGHVEGARAAGYDAHVFQSHRQVALDLWRRGLRFNY